MTVPKRPSTKRFDRAPQANIQRSSFDLSFPYKTPFDSGRLVPLPPLEILPGDSFRLRMHALARLATPLHPTLDNLYLESFFFFVPNRLVWANWQKFMGEQDNPGDSTDFTIPVMDTDTGGGYGEGGVPDYMGIPIGTNNVEHSALPLRAHNLCFNEWFRDENLQDSLDVKTDDGPDLGGTYPLQRRGKRKDYITSCLPWPQKGPGVDLPLGDSAPIYAENQSLTDFLVVEYGKGGTEQHMDTSLSQLTMASGTSGANPLRANLEEATAATINDLRQAFQIQKLQERDARGGTRYTEILRAHFQVTSPDARLQRPEYLGGGHTNILMQSVPQTSSTDATTPQGNLSAYGTGAIQGHGFTKSFVEHGYIIGFVSVRADLNYQNRLDRHWSRKTKYDFYWPALQALGEQPVYNREVWMDGTTADDDVWGYQERWAEYRTQLGVITSSFRSNAAATLDPWHYALDFQTRPALDDAFVVDTPPVKRTIAVQTEPEFLFDAWFDIKAARPMPIYSVPGYIDHF
ncbi:major capsid protein [Microviridae sp.]|nr:major capsid protein [Microviridae sp.]